MSKEDKKFADKKPANKKEIKQKDLREVTGGAGGNPPKPPVKGKEYR